MNPEISVIICTRNRDEMIVDVLKSLKDQTLEKKQYEVLIIDQSTNEKTQELMKKYNDFKYTKLNSRGVSISRNEGIKQAQGDILVFIDDDILFDENYLSIILDCFKKSNHPPEMIGGKTHIKFLGEKPDWIEGNLLGILAHSDFGEETKEYGTHPKHVPYTCNMAVKKGCIDKVGGFSNFISVLDKKLPINDDVIFANKVRSKGHKILYCPQRFVYHRMPSSRLTYEYYKNKYYSHGHSDAYAYYLLNIYSIKEIPLKLVIHLKRMVEGVILKNFKKIPSEKCYQHLRFYYNAGYIEALVKILINFKKIEQTC